MLSANATAVVSPADAERLAGLAALTGRMELATKFPVRATSPFNAVLAFLEVTAVSSRLFIRAALGVCDDSVALLRQDVERLL